MTFRSERRRRVFPDEPAGTSAEDGTASRRDEGSPKSSGPGSRYAVAAKREARTRFSDFLPTRFVTVAPLFVAGWALCALLLAGHLWRVQIAAKIQVDPIESLDLSSLQSLGTWTQGLLCNIAAVGCLIIYSLRRHRLDDYHGRYRVWLWSAAACILMGGSQTADLAGLGQALLAPVARLSGVSQRMIECVVLGLVSGLLALRLLLEMRRCRAALALFLCASGAFALYSTSRFTDVVLFDRAEPLMLQTGAWFAGWLFTLLVICLYGRHVLRDIDGLLPAQKTRPKRIKRAKQAATTADSGDAGGAKPKPHIKLRSDLQPSQPSASGPAHAGNKTPSAPLRAAVQQVKSTGTSSPSSSSEDEDDHRLSRAERKRLRREQRLERRAG